MQASINNLLPEVLIDNKLYECPIGHWIAVIIIGSISYFLAKAIIKLAIYFTDKFLIKIRKSKLRKFIKILDIPLRLYLFLAVLVTVSNLISISKNLMEYINVFASIISTIAILVLLWKLVDIMVEIFEGHMSKRGNKGALSIGLFFSRTIKAILIIIASMEILSSFGIDVTTAVAALGVGGIALALGAQKAVENFVGSLNVVIDQPIRIGDFCKVGDTIGVVEEVGVRSTRIRTPDRSLVTIPNGSLASQKIENYTHRDKIKLYSMIGLTYDTTSKQLEKVLTGFRKMLTKLDYIEDDTARVRFISYGDFSLNIEIFCYVMTNDYVEFLEKQEEVNFEIMKIVEKSGSDFAFPSQTIYMEKGK